VSKGLDALQVVTTGDRVGKLITEVHARDAGGETPPADFHIVADVFKAAEELALKALDQPHPYLVRESEVVPVGLTLHSIVQFRSQTEVDHGPLL
jgi:hypothetical protein